MTRLRPIVLAVAVLVASATPATPGPLDDLITDMRLTPLDRQDAPPLAVTTLNGGRVSLADVRGHVVLVYFWATW